MPPDQDDEKHQCYPMNAETLFWELAAELQAQDARVAEGTIMNGRCLRLGKECLALVDFVGKQEGPDSNILT